MDCAVVADRFIGHLRYVRFTQTKTDRLLSRSILVRRDADFIYSGLYLESVCPFERFIEVLFTGLLVRRLSHRSPAVSCTTPTMSLYRARTVLRGGKKYIDWLPFDRTESLAEIYFRDGLPFKSLLPNEKRLLKSIHLTRNAIAHKSSHAISLFEREVIGTIPITSAERTPAGFLRSQFRKAPQQNRFENFVYELASIARRLTR